jgi:hypothetical protein
MTMPAASVRSEARVPTDQPARYLGQLCKHFAHKLPVEQTGAAGCITFPATGACHLRAEEGVLLLQAESPDAAALAQVQDVIARHLVRFAFRDPPPVAWTRLPD